MGCSSSNITPPVNYSSSMTTTMTTAHIITSYEKKEFIGACETGNIEKIKLMLQNGIHPNFKVVLIPDISMLSIVFYSETKITPLIVAACRGYLDIVKLLLKNDAWIKTVEPEGGHILYCCVTQFRDRDLKLRLGHNDSNFEEIAKLLIYAGIDINYICSNDYISHHIGWSILMHVIVGGNSELVKLLLEKGANINHVSHYGLSALMIAIIMKYSDIVQILLKADANINTPLYYDKVSAKDIAEKGCGAIQFGIEVKYPSANLEIATMIQEELLYRQREMAWRRRRETILGLYTNFD